jgi:hypothetical protein
MDEQERALPNVKPGGFNVNQNITTDNNVDGDNNPTGGMVALLTQKGDVVDFHALVVNWQDGPRGQEGTDELAEPNGAFVEDVIYAALQRLEFFEDSKYKSEYNARAIKHLKRAIEALYERSNERGARNVLGKHEV